MNIASLRMFCHVVEEGSITKAAHLSFVSQPAVTRQIRQLEDSYGTALFDREEGRLSLTEAGKLLYPYAKEILALNKEAYEGIQEQHGEMDKTLRVGASLTIGEYLLPGLIGRFKNLYPDIKFSLSIGNTPLIIGKLEADEIDIALVEGVFQHEPYKKQKIADDELILVTAYTHRWGEREEIQLDELSEEKMIWREKESGTRLITEDALRQHHVLDKIDNAMELGSTQAIKSAVEAGLGMSILPKLTLQKELKYKALREIPIKDFSLRRDFWMVQKKRRFRKEAQAYFEAFLTS
ncbi:LysR family transcriptional regulator [Lentibacillus sediminis]|uniref:LysR family transcriptional regulator n=1 Tax=Lentibacillus sediminis TaxID=1940529 RepID=UPI001EFCF9E3|nr:LysR family transcriptional regulator [Lentibacillus sediminis]